MEKFEMTPASVNMRFTQMVNEADAMLQTVVTNSVAYLAEVPAFGTGKKMHANINKYIQTMNMASINASLGMKRCFVNIKEVFEQAAITLNGDTVGLWLDVPNFKNAHGKLTNSVPTEGKLIFDGDALVKKLEEHVFGVKNDVATSMETIAANFRSAQAECKITDSVYDTMMAGIQHCGDGLISAFEEVLAQLKADFNEINTEVQQGVATTQSKANEMMSGASSWALR